ncbi:MAG: hypothetical protein HKP53_09935 [Eudoraea sp.]|nr:hypothetical protein [Eudoraea sp.]
MKVLKQKSAAIFLAFLVLFSTMSFSADMHYCGETLVDFKIFEEADSCGMMAESDMDENSITKTMSCCSDLEIIIPGQDDLQLSFEEVLFGSQTFLVTNHIYRSQISLDYSLNEFVFREYEPPILVRDIQILDQTFLI